MALEWYEWNPFMFKKLAPIISDNWVFADVGANKGEFTDFFKATPYKKIYAFELNPPTAAFLKDKYSREPNIIVENYAVCDADSSVPYFNGAADTCINIIGHDMDFKNMAKIGDIKSIRLDSYFKNEKINLMKIDVEGAEIKVLQGLEGAINNIDHILLECHIDRDWPQLRDLLNKYNFHCINFYDDTPITESSPRPYQCFCRKKV